MLVVLYGGAHHVLTTWVTWWVSYERQDLLTFRGTWITLVFGGVHFAHLFSFLCCVFCFVWLCPRFFLTFIYRQVCVFLLIFLLSNIFSCPSIYASEYLFGIIKLAYINSIFQMSRNKIKQYKQEWLTEYSCLCWNRNTPEHVYAIFYFDYTTPPHSKNNKEDDSTCLEKDNTGAFTLPAWVQPWS